MKSVPVYVGLGEVLWDLFPEGRKLGGAPANFAFHAATLGNRGVVASRIGSDKHGRDLMVELQGLDLDLDYLQLERERATGKVKVNVDADGQPQFTIVDNVAWDRMQWTPRWRELATQADVICFGTLAQRHTGNQEVMAAFLDQAGPDTLRVFDVNLRQHFYSEDILRTSLDLCNIAKLNDDEMKTVAALFDLPGNDLGQQADALRTRFDLALVCVTRGAAGSILVDADSTDEHPGCVADVVDTVGAGDAFTAAMTHHYRAGASKEEMNEAANRLGAYVAGRAGATPAPKAPLPA